MQNAFWYTLQEFTNGQLVIAGVVVVLGLFLAFALGAGWGAGIIW